MERGIEGMEWMGSGPNPHERQPESVRASGPDWGGTGLCAEAQADGVPCTIAGRSCDTCSRFTASRQREQVRLRRGPMRAGSSGAS
jgi:hypothetical protein